jgi:hypothetical protein
VGTQRILTTGTYPKIKMWRKLSTVWEHQWEELKKTLIDGEQSIMQIVKVERNKHQFECISIPNKCEMKDFTERIKDEMIRIIDYWEKKGL